MQFDGLAGWVGTSVVGLVLVAGAVLVLNERDARIRGDGGAAGGSLVERQQQLTPPSLHELEAARDAAQAELRAAQKRGDRGAVSAALDRFNAIGRRLADAKLRHANGN